MRVECATRVCLHLVSYKSPPNKVNWIRVFLTRSNLLDEELKNCQTVDKWKRILNKILKHGIKWTIWLESNSSLNPKRLAVVRDSWFSLLQHGLQSGPLKGAKPAYFRRCSMDVLQFVVQIYLPKICTLGFTNGQIAAVNIWKTNARKRSSC